MTMWILSGHTAEPYSPPLADVEQVAHHAQQQLGGADGAVVICCHLLSDQVLALFSRQLLASPKRVDVNVVVDIVTAAGDK